ncbi:DUF6290 family protein [Wolbachia endosymbiont (group B) of Silvanus unidentatus]|uniref:DUF6290 family protein n=2 Tax=unclassified Wolbachia TaxID=2640676 RepID=UPI003342794A
MLYNRAVVEIGKLMTDSGLNISEKVLKNLARLAKVKNQSVQELAEQFIQEAIENEEDMAIAKLAIQRDTRNAKFIRHEDINW